MRRSARRADVKPFYGELSDFDALDVPILGQLGLLLRTDAETSQFLLVTIWFDVQCMEYAPGAEPKQGWRWGGTSA